MWPTRPLLRLLIVLLTAGLMQGCASDPGSSDGVGPPTTTSGEVADGPQPSEAVGPPLLVVRRLRPGADPLATAPDVFVTGDGWMLTPGGEPRDGVPEPEARRLDEPALDRIRAAVAGAGLDQAPSAPGTGSVELTWRRDDGIVAVNRGEEDDAELAALLDVLAVAVRSGTAVRYRPVRFLLIDEGTAPSGRRWPVEGLPLSTIGACAEAGGEQAVSLVSALRSAAAAKAVERAGTGAVRVAWSDGSGNHRVVVRSLLPGETGCPLDAP